MKVKLVLALGTAQVLAWGSTYYLLAILAEPISAELGVRTPWVFGALSAGLILAAFLGPTAGRLIDIGAPDALIRRHCPERTVVLTTDDPSAGERLAAIPLVASVTPDDGRYTLRGAGDGFVSAVIRGLSESRITVTDLRTVHPTLEDVFLRLTGHSIRD